MNPLSFEENRLVAEDGLGLFTRRAIVERPRAEVVLVHGMGEHSARYFHVAEQLAAEGFRLCALDLRGHGRSEGRRGYLRNYDLMTSDVQQAWRHFAEAGLPMFLYGHSLGGQIALNFVLRHQPPLAGAVIASPWLRLAFEPPRWKLMLAHLARCIYPGFTQGTGMRSERLSRDSEFLAAMRDLDLVHHRMSAGMFFAIKEAARCAGAGAAEITCPILLLHGAEDPITSAQATEEFFGRIASPDKSLRLYPGRLHETHNDIGRDEVIGDVVRWLVQRTADHPPQSAFS